MKKVLTVIGARPQFIKAAPVSRKLREQFDEILVNTGQHYDFRMSGIFFNELNIPKPDFNLGVGSGSHGEQTGEMLKKIEEVLVQESPDVVLTYGDTNSTLAAALAASKLHIPIGHVEAGLRSFNKKMPEEINRIMTDHVSQLLFTPTENAVRHLSNEGITEGVHNVGDVMYDAFLYNLKLAEAKLGLKKFNLETKQYHLATIHRAENTDNPARLKGIFEALSHVDKEVLIPLHPRTEKFLEKYELKHLVDNPGSSIHVIPPVSYLEMLLLLKHAATVITDSGGVQKEAYFSKVPCFTIRDETEWTETVEAGWNILVDPVHSDLKNLMSKEVPTNHIDHLYGDGNAARKIVDCLSNFLD